jgi:sugar/nucleoside kinase (ribokinase family)
MQTQPHLYDVVGLGNALVDSLVVVDEAALAGLEFQQGVMHPVDGATWDRVFARYQGHGMEIHSGGSCPNTMATLGLLGVRTAFRGQVGNDEMGARFLASLGASCDVNGVNVVAGASTGRCLALVRRTDGDRTFLVHLGTATELADVGPFEAQIQASRMLHVTGYPVLQPPIREAAFRALDVARAAGVSVSFDVADPFVIRAIRDDIWWVLKEYADVVFLNEEEAAELCDGMPPEDAVHELSRYVDTVVVKLGVRGSLVERNGVVTPIGALRVNAVDTTGAGDSYAAGFLYGHVHGWSAERCGRLGTRIAALNVTQLGAVYQDAEQLGRAVEACVEQP